MAEALGSPSAYAQVVPRLRVLKAGLLGPRVKDLSPPLAEALASLRDTMYSGIAEAKELRLVERKLAQQYFGVVDELEGLAPDEAKGLVRAFAEARETEDLMTLARALAEGLRLPAWLPSLEWSRSSIRDLMPELEASPSLTRLPDLLKGGPLRKTMARALEAFSEVKSPEAFTWYSLSARLAAIQEALEPIGGQDRTDAEKVICPLVEEWASLAALQAWALKVNPRTFARALPQRPLCGVQWASLAEAYERNLSEDIASLITELSKMVRRVKVEGRSLRDVMSSVRRSARVAAMRSAMAVFEGYPYSPALIAATLLLLTIDVDNLRAALLGIGLGLTPAELEAAIV
ncbi:MAG: Archaeal/vacuolar-type H+-ATPase subunit C [uncultured Acidilobus sp. CIS]|nr:MAG: Archaeal/vacuolar-type H+-ATPase subunit C [uncultured Acidilobus sp. CIS]